MAFDAEELVVANSGHVYLAPLGTTLPTAEDSVLDAAFEDLGYFSEDGVTINVAREISDARAWQARSALRRLIASETPSLTFQMEQWNSENVAVALGGGVWTEPTVGHFKYTPPDADEGLTDYALVLDFEDVAGTIRFTASKVELEGDVSIVLQRNNLALLPVTFTVLETGTADLYNVYTDMAQFEATGS